MLLYLNIYLKCYNIKHYVTLLLFFPPLLYIIKILFTSFARIRSLLILVWYYSYHNYFQIDFGYLLVSFQDQ